MDDFYKNIKDNLENRPEPPFDERAWRSMEKRLNQKPLNGTKPFGWFWALPFVLGALLISNIFFYKNLNEANEKISKLELRTDTIVQTRFIYQYDTIYRSSVEKEYIVINAQPQPDFYASQSLFANNSSGYITHRSNWLNTSRAPLTFADLKYLFDNEQVTQTAILIENDLLVLDNTKEGETGGFHSSPYLKSPLTSLNYDGDPLKFSYSELNIDEQRKRKRPLQKLASNLQKPAFQLGAGAGLAFPQHEDVTETGGFSIGINGAMSFTDNLRIIADASFYKVEFRSNVMGESLGIPEVDPPSDEYEFKEASVKQPFLQYNFGLQYIFNTKKKWSPYFGFGYTLASMKSYEVFYDFDHIAGDIEATIEKQIDRNDLIANMFLFNGGIEGELSKRIGLQFEGYYRWYGNNDGVLVTNIWGLRSNLIYKF